MPSAALAVGKDRARPRIARSWQAYVAENHVEDVFKRGGEMPAFLDEQTELMRKMLRAAGAS